LHESLRRAKYVCPVVRNKQQEEIKIKGHIMSAARSPAQHNICSFAFSTFYPMFL